MDLGQRLRDYREKQKLSQDDFAKKLFVSRQAVSRWENNKTVPSLYSLTQIADLYQIPVETLLKEDEYTVTKKLDREINRSKIYRRIFLGLIALIVIFLGILSYGRKNQIDMINYINPFLKMKTEYAIVPEKIPVKNGEAQAVEAFVTDNPFGQGEWLKFQVGKIPEKGMNYVVLEHKGSFVRRARLISRSDIPKIIRVNIGTEYFEYEKNTDTPKSSWNPFK